MKMNFLKTYIAPFAGFFVAWLFIAFIKLDANVVNWGEISRFVLLLLGFLYGAVYAVVFGFEKEDKK